MSEQVRDVRDRWPIPASWSWATMEDVAEVVGGGTPPTTEPSNYGGAVPWVTPADLSGYTAKAISGGSRSLTTKGLNACGARMMPAGTVLFSSRAPIGYVAIAANPLSTNQGFKSFVIKRQDLSSDYVYYYLQRARDLAVRRASGTTFLEISGAKAKTIPIPIPPPSDQDCIVAEIEKQFTRLDAGVAALERLQAHLRRYRAAVLKAACAGRLVQGEAEIAAEHHRTFVPASALLAEANTAERKPPSRRPGRLWGSGVVPDLTEEERRRLPDGWLWAKVSALGARPDDAVQVGPMSMKSSDFSESGTPVLNVGCVKWGYIDESKCNFLPVAKASAFARYVVQPGDVLFTRSGTVGRCAVAQQEHAGWLMTFHLLRVRPDAAKCLPEFLRIALEGAPHITRQTREASIGTTRAGFNTNLLAGLDVPLPPMAEQIRIVAAVEAHLSRATAVEEQITTDLARSGRLRASILCAAFEGRLVAPAQPARAPAA